MTKHILIEGRVQGVAYRYYTKIYADKLGLKGTVKNLENGHVEVYVTGQTEELTRFEGDLLNGSPYSQVLKITTTDIDLIEFKDFSIIM